MEPSKKSKTIIALYDTKIQYLTLAQSKYGLYVVNHDSVNLDADVLKNGEVLKADLLKKTLQKIAKKINIKTIDLIIPHDHLLFELQTIPNPKKIKPKKLLKRYLKQEKNSISWAASHDYEYDMFNMDNESRVLFRALPRAIHTAYQYIFKKSGLTINSIHSDIVAFQSLFAGQARSTQIYVDTDHSYVVEYKNGMYVSAKKFALSRNQLVQDIKKNVQIDDAQAEKILTQYGVLGIHPDKKVLQKLERSMMPLLDSLHKRKIERNKKSKTERKYSLFVHFSNTPILGFVDRLARRVSADVSFISVLESTQYTFQDVLTIHKKESYAYEALIARAAALLAEK